jgi:hypothetical protein
MARWTGRVGGEPGTLVFADATLTVGKRKTVERAAPHGSFELRTEDGLVLRVEAIEHAQKAGKIELSGPYGRLLSHPIARLFAKSAPGDHVAASIRGFGIFGGDLVTVEGDVVEERVADGASDGGMREAPTRVPAVVRATRIHLGEAAGPATESASEGPRAPAPEPQRPRARPHYPLETSTRVYASLGAPLFVGALVTGWIAPLVPARAWLTLPFCVGLVLLLVAANRHLRTRHHASYVTEIGGRRITPREPTWGYLADRVLVPFCYLMWLPMTALEPSPSAATFFTAAPAVLVLVHAALLAANDRALRAFAAVVLRTPVADPRGARMVAIEGKVVEPGTALRRRVEHFRRSEVSYTTEKNGSTTEQHHLVWRDREHTSGQPFTLELASGAKVVVTPAGARVAFARRAWEATEGPSQYAELLQAGEPVLVVGRFEERGGELHVAARGEESLFVWAGSRPQLVRAWAVAHLQILAMLGLAAVPVLLGLYAFPFAARYRTRGVVTSSTRGDVPAGASCSLSVLAYHYGDEPRCSATLDCGREHLFGGFGMGQTDCTIPASPFDTQVSGDDPLTTDGDPSLRFSLAGGTALWSDGAGTISIALDPAEPSLVR